MPTSQMLSDDSDVHQGLGGPSYDVTSTVEETESSDNVPLSTLVRKMKGKRVKCISKHGSAEAKEKIPPVGAKREKLGFAESWGKTAARSLSNRCRNTRTPPAPTPSSLGDEENTSRICEFFLENTETSSGAGQKIAKGSFPTSEDDVEAAEALLCMSHVEVQTNSLSKTAIEGQAQSKAKDKGLLDGQVTPVEVSGLPQENQTEYVIPVCVINRNPSEFETEQAKKFLWRC